MMDLDKYIEENKSNITIDEIVKKFNISIPTVYRHLRLKGIKPKKTKNTKRFDEINQMRKEGKTYQEIGNIYGISRQRVEQIIHEYN